MKQLFQGRKKYFTIPLAALFGLFFLPLTLIALIAFFAKSKITNSKIKAVIYSILGVIALPFMAAYAIAFTSPSDTSISKATPAPVVEGVSVSSETPTPTISPTEEPKTDEYKVTRIIDGDTFEIEGGQRVRLIGIDTPELSGTVECYGREAYDKAVELLEGRSVRLEKDVSETDRYARLLRYVYLEDTFINKLLVSEGYANASSYPPDIKHQDDLRQAEQEARNANRGLWKGCSTPKPVVNTPKPTVAPAVTTAPNTNSGNSNQQPSSGGAYACSCSKTCTQISSCAEAQYQLNVCGCGQRDADDDGIACDGAPLNCQN